MSERKIRLDLTLKSQDAVNFELEMQGKIVGQTPAVQAVAGMYKTVLAEMERSGQPVAIFLFLGPTGTGKTRIVEATSEIIFRKPKAFIKVNCAEYQERHEVARLIGSPPGYIGHRETDPLITQKRLEQFHTDDLKLNFVLFDEIEKASYAVWQLLLGILDKGELGLGDNKNLDFSRSVIFMTSNLGSAEMSRELIGGLGFTPGNRKASQQRLESITIEEAKRTFSPEFMNRIDRIVVFNSLGEENLREILEIELRRVKRRIPNRAGGGTFRFELTSEAKDFLLREGASAEYGARHLKRAIERHLVVAFSSLIATGQVEGGDMLEIDVDESGSGLGFEKKVKSLSAGS